MTNHRVIAIGINQYQFLQPLNYAQADAQALWNFLIEEAGWATEQCLLLTDTSLPVYDQSTYPSQDNLLDWIDRWCEEQVSSQDLLCFYFSGYGVTANGEDYLIPIDGNTADIPNTAIPMRLVLGTLKSSSADNILVLLDINRSQGTQGSTSVGAQTVELAKEMGIATILSCQLNQYSHEASSLGHGLFTAALLEGLRYHQGRTLESLDQFLHKRLLELSDHHLQPIQTPLTVIPSLEINNQLLKLLLQKPETAQLNQMSEIGSSALYEPSDTPSYSTLKESQASTSSLPPTLIPIAAGTEPRQAALVPYANGKSPDADKTPLGSQMVFWLGSIALVAGMIGGVFLRNKAAFTGQQVLNPLTPVSSPSTLPTAVSPNATPTAISTQSLPSTASGSSSNSQQAILLPQKQTANIQGQPPTGSQVVLNKAKSYILPNQASQFTLAINEARKIQPGDPLYNQAQQEIASWSREIVNLAEMRAKQGQFDKAIAAARLVPKDNPTTYTAAQQAITRWREQAQQQRTNQILLQAAKGLVRPGQASSYNRAITAARKVPPTQPGSAERDRLVAQWSKEIYLIAQSRASRGQYKEAVQTATLIPQGTPFYNNAQKAVVKWKQGKK